MALMTPEQANDLVQDSLTSKLNEAIRHAASQGQKRFVMDLGPWTEEQRKQAIEALESSGYRCALCEEKYASPTAYVVQWS